MANAIANASGNARAATQPKQGAITNGTKAVRFIKKSLPGETGRAITRSIAAASGRCVAIKTGD